MTTEANSYPLMVTGLVETLITAMVQVSPVIIVLDKIGTYN